MTIIGRMGTTVAKNLIIIYQKRTMTTNYLLVFRRQCLVEQEFAFLIRELCQKRGYNFVICIMYKNMYTVRTRSIYGTFCTTC